MGMPANANPPKALAFATLSVAVVFLLLFALGAFAQDASPVPTPTETMGPSGSATAPVLQQPQPPSRFYLEVDQADLQLIAQAINELPKRVADPLILKLQGQLQPPAQAKIIENKEAAEKPKRGKK